MRGTHETFSRAPFLSLGLGIKLDCVTWCVKAGECRTSAGDALFRRSWAGNWALLFRNAGRWCDGGRSVIVIVGNPRLRFPPIPFLPGSRSGLRANAQGHRGLRVLYSSQVSARCGTRGRRRVAFGGGGARAGTENTMPVFLGSRLDTWASTQGFSRLIYCFRLPGGLGRRT